jgi:dUTPase
MRRHLFLSFFALYPPKQTTFKTMSSFQTSNTLLAKAIEASAVLPVRGSVDSAGFDLASAYDVVVPAHGKAIVKTDLAVATPPGCYARIGNTSYILFVCAGVL